MEINEILYGIDSQYHMLRHFESSSNELIKELINLGYTTKQIERELREPGSRFSRSFATDIPTLLEMVFINGFSTQIGSNGNIILNGSVIEKDYVSGIGTKSVVSVKDLGDLERIRIFIKKNRGVDLLHLEVDVLPSTLEFTIILKKVSSGYVFITAFPGEPAMPLPDIKMENSLFDQCRRYWDDHVFLVKK